MLKALSFCLLLITGIAHATDRDIDNDGTWGD